jgi:hypothetical protein
VRREILGLDFGHQLGGGKGINEAEDGNAFGSAERGCSKTLRSEGLMGLAGG